MNATKAAITTLLCSIPVALLIRATGLDSILLLTATATGVYFSTIAIVRLARLVVTNEFVHSNRTATVDPEDEELRFQLQASLHDLPEDRAHHEIVRIAQQLTVAASTTHQKRELEVFSGPAAELEQIFADASASKDEKIWLSIDKIASINKNG